MAPHFASEALNTTKNSKTKVVKHFPLFSLRNNHNFRQFSGRPRPGAHLGAEAGTFGTLMQHK